MNQAEFNRQFEEQYPLPADPDEALKRRYSRPLTTSQLKAIREGARIDQETAQHQAERQKLDQLASRKAYAWKRRQMLQRGRRY